MIKTVAVLSVPFVLLVSLAVGAGNADSEQEAIKKTALDYGQGA